MPEPQAGKGTCFVVMGFGKKTDFETGRALDLNMTYNYIIKPAVIDAGLQCCRADEIKHSGQIDVPMYEQLLNADVVIADLSTANQNAYYELGVRHALRPYTTIVICEDGIKKFPFDINHVVVQQYHHMGDGIDYGEVERFRKVLKELIAAIYAQNPRRGDSPVYTFLTGLSPPALAKVLQAAAQSAVPPPPPTMSVGGSGPVFIAPAPAPAAPAAPAENGKFYSELLDDVETAKKSGDFAEAKSLLKLLRKKMMPKTPDTPEDPYIIQQLALVTYKAKYPTPAEEVTALRESCDLLYRLNPTTSNDTETLGLWGAVHKRLWDKARDAVALDKAVRSYERGFNLRNDHYNGINFAFLLNVRAAYAVELAKASADPAVRTANFAAAVADFVQAQRVREEVSGICDQWLTSNPPPPEAASAEAKKQYLENKYWLLATKAEACLGMGKTAEAEGVYKEASAIASGQWMIDSTQDQRRKLSALLGDSPLQHVTAN